MAEYIKVNTKIIDVYGSFLPSPVIQVYIGLLRYADSRGLADENITQYQWAEKIGVGRTTFQGALIILKELSLIEVIRPKNPSDCCAYIIRDPDTAKTPRKYTLDEIRLRKNQISA